MPNPFPFRQSASGALPELIRSELFGEERLEQHAESLARAQRVTAKPEKGRPLLQRVEDNGSALRTAYEKIAEAVREERWITPAAEWLLDNFHIVDEQLREIRDDLPHGFYRELPKLAEGHLEGYPRVYGIAWAFVAHTDSRLDADVLRRFVQAYQRVDPLSIGELWAIAISLRVVLVENLRRCAEVIVRARVSRNQADALADDLVAFGDRSVRSTAALQEFDHAVLAPAFAVALIQRLRDRDPAVTPALIWLRERLAAQGTTIDNLVADEHQRQAAMTVTVRNIITSMRLLSSFDWTEFFESVSLVDTVLRSDPTFPLMDFDSRDAYRHAIEKLARGSGHSQLDVARRAVERAKRAQHEPLPTDSTSDERRAETGYHLVGPGRRAFEQELGFRAAWGLRLLRAYIAAATPGYLGSIVLLTGLILTIPLTAAVGAGVGTAGLITLAILAAFPASDVAIALLNRSVTALLTPRLLPRLELREGVPPHLRTMVVIPTLFASRSDVEEQVERLEVHYLANSEGDVRFALLSDWLDARTEHAPNDEELRVAAREGIAGLNRLHGPAPGGGPRFLLYHRRRLWNPAQRRWMGWERKRGKLEELNRLLRGAADTTFFLEGDEADVPADVRYIVTVDSDTRLPIGAVRQLVGTLAHPLNRPRFDPKPRRVVEGYGILQPRVTTPLPGRKGSFFQQLSSGNSGVDPYAAAVSDVYQDVFGEGSFTGKGIYHVDAFEAALAGRVPENTLLSHDLLEGVFARTGLVTDIEVFEGAPSSYAAAAARQHRWARGDWQLLPFILRAKLPLIARWKMVDNLRRTLSAPAMFLTLSFAWTWPLAPSIALSLFVLGAIVVPLLLPVCSELLPRKKGISKRSHLGAIGRDLAIAAWHAFFAVTNLAHQAWLMGDAILRTLVRLVVTRRNLLEWVTAAQASSQVLPRIVDYYRRMFGALVLAAAAAVAVSWMRPEAWTSAQLPLMLWAISPFLAAWISTPAPDVRASKLTHEEAQRLRTIARRTWRFFTEFVGAESRALPPDNFQESPSPVVAHRTSPTNIGMYLLSVVVARDFGWLGALDTVSRLEATLETIKGLEHFRGHLYNWYGTQDGRPLEPKYISSVDSGNLAGALIALENACRDLIDQPLLGAKTIEGLGDTERLVHAAVYETFDDRRRLSSAERRLNRALEDVSAAIHQTPRTPAELAAYLDATEASVHAMKTMALQDVGEKRNDDDAELLAWIDALRADVESHSRDLETLMPWARLRTTRAAWEMEPLATHPTLAELPDRCATVAQDLTDLRARLAPEEDARLEELADIDALIAAVKQSAAAAESLMSRFKGVAADAHAMVAAMEFGFLFDATRKLFSIGYRVAESGLDPGRYDLLASEARLLGFLAVAKGDAPVSHWFHLGRPLTPLGRDSVLMSWSGSMFEYLMPALIMRTPVGSLLEQTCRLAVSGQIAYGNERGVPWGVSESGYNARDLELTYKYSNFGVPGMGMQRGLSDDVVIAPYATGLAAMIDPAAALRNFEVLKDEGAMGPYGFYEAIDYTESRVPSGKRSAVVRCYMAHHQGMLLVAIANALENGLMRARFHAEPMVRASELLLEERTPRSVAVARPRAEEFAAIGDVRESVAPRARRYTTPHGPVPQTHLLSNRRYAVMLTAAGSGYSRWRDIAVTRWREDATCDDSGTYFFLRDVDSGESWSAGFQPCGVEPESYEATFFEDRAEIIRRDGSIVTKLEVIVSSEDEAEVRRVSLTNLGLRTREIDVTSYAEVVLATHAADVAHRAFSNLFVHTEMVRDNVLLATRRPRSQDEAEVWLAHLMSVEGRTVGDLQWETDRARFVGRGHALRTARALVDGAALSNTVGPVLDPIVSLRRRVRLRPGSTIRLCFATLVGPTREAVLDLAEKYQDGAAFERAATLAWTHAQVQLHHVGISSDEASLFQNIAGSILYANRSLRAGVEVLQRSIADIHMLWANGISGDFPIVVIHIDDPEDIGIVRQLLRAHEYWRTKQLEVDLVILNDRAPSYMQDLQSLLQTLVRARSVTTLSTDQETHGKIFILRTDQLSTAQRDTLNVAARVILSSRGGSLDAQVDRRNNTRPASTSHRRMMPKPQVREAGSLPPLEFFNGLGGFDDGGREYVTVLGPTGSTPAPWINVIANPEFGTLISESGSSCSWSTNSREHQLTPWSNDPVSDPSGEILYVRDEESGELWGPTAFPIRVEDGQYIVRHGQGYSRFEHDSHGIGLELLQLVALEDPLKISRLTLTNHSGRVRRLSVAAYVEWVLGTARGVNAPFVVTEVDENTGALLARNSLSVDFAARVAFIDFGGDGVSLTGDRAEFLGRNGTTAHPAALERRGAFSGRVGAALDPCGAMRKAIEIPDGGRAEVTFLLGEAATREEARTLILRYRAAGAAESLSAVTARWDEILAAVQVKTPDRAMDLMMNRWLLYQTISSRLWARSGFYQASGAYGFRDQLQDVLALVATKPDLAREHVLRAAARQFVEGDVQHWWHAPRGRGIRTRFSDDLLWLPYVAARYVEKSGDTALLDEEVPFLEGPLLLGGEEESYFEPTVSGQHASLYEHCARAIDRSLVVGSHGLPLMGTGDWNDGMNRVGAGGKGESVWLGWFLCAILPQWATLAQARGERERATAWREHMGVLKQSLEGEGWDGEWYRRAFFDDGTPLGSRLNDECRIDSIAQSWSVISGAGDPDRQRRAMRSFETQLVRKNDAIILLLTPPFDRSPLDPGYIKGYLPGIRENGAQYTHAAIWAVIAYAMLGDGDKALELFDIINPITHSRNERDVDRYKVEPYVLAADVYSQSPHVGRGGWTWYTGSSSWMYQAGLEWILGFRLRGARLVIDPCIPHAWPGFSMAYRYRTTRYEIVVENPHRVSRGVSSLGLDGVRVEDAAIPLVDDGRTHRVDVVLGERRTQPGR
jgi:cyclic beta-1,2-glucan synthetase